MRNLTVQEIDQAVDKWVGLFAALTAGAGGMAKAWPFAALALIAAIAMGVVIVAQYLDRKRMDAFIADWTDTDARLADVANADVERAA